MDGYFRGGFRKGALWVFLSPGTAERGRCALRLLVTSPTLKANYMRRKKIAIKHRQTIVYCEYAIHAENKANRRDLIAANCLVFLLKIGFKSSIFQPV